MTLSFSDTYRLNNGIEMPRHGFGVYKLTDEARMRTALETAVDVGYRLFDTASFYHNEKRAWRLFCVKRLEKR